jgi:hypothetical protein
MLTPDAKQNRLSYLVELVLDKFRKGISNKALKTRLRKDSTTFGATDMRTDIRSIGKFLGSRTLEEVTRHRCGNDECSHAWIGAVDPVDFDSNDCCHDCGTARYTRKGGKLVPRRIFYYFGAVQAIEGLHRHHVFRENWKKKIDLSMNDYRFSKDAQRLNAATRGEALADMNGLYISMADGFQSHNFKTQSITGNVSLCLSPPCSISKLISLLPLLLLVLMPIMLFLLMLWLMVVLLVPLLLLPMAMFLFLVLSLYGVVVVVDVVAAANAMVAAYATESSCVDVYFVC